MAFIKYYIPHHGFLKAIINDWVWRALARVILFPALGRNLPY